MGEDASLPAPLLRVADAPDDAGLANGRQHIHRSIDDAELPVTHRTIRKGSPFTLHLAKQRDLHQREAEGRSRLAADLAWLRG